MSKNDKFNNDLTNSYGQTFTGNNENVSPNRALIILILSIFFAELAIMIVFFVLPPIPPIPETIIDAATLILIVSPIVYRFAVIPLHKQIEKTNNARDQLESLNLGLEKRVSDRTKELENALEGIIRRAAQFESIAGVAHMISSTQSVDTLLPQITEAISEKFGYYHVGIFLVDSGKEYAILVAANSEGGKRMLDRNHRLLVGGAGIVGYVTGSGQPRVALDVGLDAAYFNNPDLPDTHSEIALPLRSGPDLFGALDVQSTETNAFTQEDVSILSALADQVSVAIQNARSLQQSREALAQVEVSTSQMVKKQWHEFLEQQSVRGFSFDGIDTKRLNSADKEPAHSLAIPLTLRGTRIGTLKLNAAADPNRTWTDDEIAIVQATAERTAIAIESARLLLEAQKRATKERTIGEISSKISSLVNIDNILQTAIQELGNTMPNTDIAIQFKKD